MIEKSNIQKVLAFFFKYPTKETYLRELSRMLQLSMPTILGAVKKLKQEDLVQVKHGKALTSVKANMENQLFIRMKRVHNLEQLYASGLVNFLITACKRPRAIICFGSYARGDDIETSDIDIALIGGQEPKLNLDGYILKFNRQISLHYIFLSKISDDFKANLCNGIILEGAL